MKKVALFLFSILIANLAISQSLSDVFNKDTQITWLGLDFSHAKMIGEFSQFNGAGDYTASEVRDKYYPGWNRLILEESDKYNLREMIRQDDVFIDIDMVMDRNAAVSRRDLEGHNPPNYKPEDIAQFVSEYDLGEKSGIGMVMIVEYFSKNSEDAVFHFVLLDLASKDVLLHEEIKSTPRGFGIRNYWGGSIYHVMQEIQKNRYARWKSEYGR